MALRRLASAMSQTALSNFKCSPFAAQSLDGGPQSLLVRCFGEGAYLDKNAVAERVIAMVKNFDKVDPNKVSSTSSFKDLGLDSLDTVEVVMAMEEDFCVEIPDSDADKIASVSDAIEYFAAHPHAK